MNLHPQFTYDQDGNATGVFLDIRDWQLLIKSYQASQKKKKFPSPEQKVQTAQIVGWGEFPTSYENERTG